MSSNEESHGETTRGVFENFLHATQSLIVFDELETALSLKAQYEYWVKLKKLSENNQIIMITHSKVFMEEAEELFDMESKGWMKTSEYLKKIKESINN
jgi:predicted ATPase